MNCLLYGSIKGRKSIVRYNLEVFFGSKLIREVL